MSTALATKSLVEPQRFPDPTFDAWANDGLVWLPHLGMGWLNVTAAPYDAEYFRKYEGYAATEQGRAITAARGSLVRRYALGVWPAVDVGIGCGQFMDEVGCYGYDVNPAGLAMLKSRNRFFDIYEYEARVVTFWDALEHVPEPARLLANAADWVFCSLPIVPGDGPPRADWKHFRRDEHTWYWTRRGLIRWMAAQGFGCLDVSAMETLIGREDIETFVFRRNPQ